MYCLLFFLRLIKATARRFARLSATITPLLTLCIALLLPTLAAGQTNTWLGASNLILPWSDPTNWSLGTVPDGVLTNIEIPQGGVADDYSITLLTTLTIDAPAHLFLLSTTSITNTNLINVFGTISGSGTLVNGSTDVINLGGGTITGSVTLVNAGFIGTEVGQSVIGVNVNQTGTGTLGPRSSTTLVLDGAHVTGGYVNGVGEIVAQNGATLQDLNIGSPIVVNNFGGSMNLGGSLGIEGTVTVLDKAFLTLASGATINNNGSLLNQAGGTVSIFGTLNNSVGIGNSGLFQVANGGVVNNTGTISNFLGGGFAVQSGGTLNNSGSFISDSFSSFGTLANSTVVNTGTMSLSGNIVAIGGSLRNDGSITLTGGPVLGDPPIAQPPPPLFIASTGTLSGTGVVNGTVIVQGNMSPGNSPGLFTINGSYVQSSSGHLMIELGGLLAGTQYDVLDVHGGATLAGFLDVGLFGGFDPTADAFFDVLLTDDLLGTFDTVNLPTSGYGVFSLEYLLNANGLDSVRIVFDYGDDGLPQFPGPTREGLPPPGTQVPEPSAIDLMLVGLVGIALMRKKLFRVMH